MRGVVFQERLDELLEECGRLHGHVCPGQLLGVRMALLGCEMLGIHDPRGADRKKLLVWVEIDRCMTDAVSAVTRVSLGRRSLKFVDYGKVAATFLNTETGEAVRIVALDSARSLACERYPQLQKKEQQMRTYREALDSELFKTEKVRVKVNELDMPGRPKSRVTCGNCGEGINDGREIRTDLQTVLCRFCNGGGYYT